MTKHFDFPYINYILDVIKDIEDSIENISINKLERDKDKKEANVRRIEIISKAVKNISEGVKSKYPEIKWERFIDAGDMFNNHYFGVDINILWDILKSDIPNFKQKLLEIKEDLMKL